MLNKKKVGVQRLVAEKKLQELSIKDMDQIVATGQYTAKEMSASKECTKLLQTKSILKKLHLS